MKIRTLLTVLACLASTFVSAQASRHFRLAPSVYTMSNSPEGNEIIVYSQQWNGQLVESTRYETGGNGNGGGLQSIQWSDPLRLCPHTA